VAVIDGGPSTIQLRIFFDHLTSTLVIFFVNLATRKTLIENPHGINPVASRPVSMAGSAPVVAAIAMPVAVLVLLTALTTAIPMMPVRVPTVLHACA
jgi:hypothetical protein